MMTCDLGESQDGRTVVFNSPLFQLSTPKCLEKEARTVRHQLLQVESVSIGSGSPLEIPLNNSAKTLGEGEELKHSTDLSNISGSF